ncbi:hypothetical protein MUP77_24160 [Candidatus Bathyarchaeota archaeon]|nr:hypothetical protein [Candidatus Bathyarchaeota archaeon]
MNVFAQREVSYDVEAEIELKELVESTPFGCRIIVCPEARVGLIRIEYRSHSEKEARACDLKIIAKMINFFEAKGSRKITFFPLEIMSGPKE